MKNILTGILFIIAVVIYGEDNQMTNRVIEYNGKATPKNIIEVYAHRANRGLMPEQTFPAYKEALRVGCDYIDMDVNMTKDGVVVITHDLGLNPNLTRDENGKWVTDATPIYSMTYNELKKFNVGKLKKGTDYAKFFPYQKSVDFTPIPKLVDIIKYVKKISSDKVGFQIEIKNDPAKPELSPSPEKFADALYKILKDENIIDRTEIQAFDWRCLIALNKIDPEVKTAYLTDHTTEVLTDEEKGTWTAGLLPKDYDYSFPKMIKSLGGYCWEPYEEDLTKEALDEAHKLGLKVVVWGWPEMEKTEFSYPMIDKLIDWHVDGIITDRADILRGVLAAKNYNVPEGFIIND